MRRVVSVLLAATLAVFVGASAASAQSATMFASSSTSLHFALPEGWVLANPPSFQRPVIDAGLAVLPGQSRAASVIVTQLKADVSGMSMDDYKAALDGVSANNGLLLSSNVQHIPSAASPTGEWVGVLQVLSIMRDGETYEHVQFIVPMADREYTIGVTGQPGSTEASANTVGFIAATLAP